MYLLFAKFTNLSDIRILRGFFTCIISYTCLGDRNTLSVTTKTLSSAARRQVTDRQANIAAVLHND